MICVYDKFDRDFTGNGLGEIRPESCEVRWELNGTYELTLICDAGNPRAGVLEMGNVIVAPVPVEETPMIEIDDEAASSARIYSVDNKGKRAAMRSGAGGSKPVIGKYLDGTELVLLKKKDSTWWRMLGPDGLSGYVRAAQLKYERTESVPARESAVLKPRTARVQPFRICELLAGTDSLEARARHISYDLADNQVKPVYATMKTRQQAADMILEKCVDQDHDFEIYCEGEGTASMQVTEMASPLEAILGADGLIEKFGGELIRDWFTLIIVERRGADRGVRMEYGRNIETLRGDFTTEELATRIVPIGLDKDGNDLYLPELYIDSPRIGEWPHPIISALRVEDASLEIMSASEAYATMRAAAAKAFEEGADAVKASFEVGYIDLSEAEGFERFRELQRLCPGDTVRCGFGHIGLEAAQRLTGYSFDCVAEKYTSVSLGAPGDTIDKAAISARQLPKAGIPASRLAAGAVSGRALKNGSVTAEKIAGAAIETASLGDGSITTVKLEDGAVTIAKLAAEVWAEVQRMIDAGGGA